MGAEAACALVKGPKLEPVLVRLLEVVADDLVGLDQIGCTLAEPLGKALV